MGMREKKDMNKRIKMTIMRKMMTVAPCLSRMLHLFLQRILKLYLETQIPHLKVNFLPQITSIYIYCQAPRSTR